MSQIVCIRAYANRRDAEKASNILDKNGVLSHIQSSDFFDVFLRIPCIRLAVEKHQEDSAKRILASNYA